MERETALTFRSTAARDRALAKFTPIPGRSSGTPGVTSRKLDGQKVTVAVFCERVWIYWRDGNMSDARRDEFERKLRALLLEVCTSNRLNPN